MRNIICSKAHPEPLTSLVHGMHDLQFANLQPNQMNHRGVPLLRTKYFVDLRFYHRNSFNCFFLHFTKENTYISLHIGYYIGFKKMLEKS